MIVSVQSRLTLQRGQHLQRVGPKRKCQFFSFGSVITASKSAAIPCDWMLFELVAQQFNFAASEQPAMARGRWSVVFLALLGLGLCATQSGALMTTILHRECVHEEVEYDGDLVSGSFVVIDHGLSWGDEPGVELVVTSPSGTKVASIFANEGQKFEFQAHQRGLYKFCFNNPASTPETISFHIHVGHVPGIEDLAKDDHLKPVHVKIARIREALAAVTEEQIYLRARDLRHRTTNESTNRRLITYTVGEYVCLVGVSLGQVYLIRKLFDKRLGYNRV